MSTEKTNSEEVSEIVDRIFSLHHNIVNQMINSYQNLETRKYPKMTQIDEDAGFSMLSEYFEKLRIIIRRSIELEEDIDHAEFEKVYNDEDLIRELLVHTREEARKNITNIIKSRIESLYISMNFVPVSLSREGKEIGIFDSVYEGLPEQHIREVEYDTLLRAVAKQVGIIEIEDYFARHSTEKDTYISPFISSTLIDAIADRAKYAFAEEQYEKYINESMKQEESFDEFPELMDTETQVEYLRIEERYKRKFEKAVGYMNDRTTYAKRFFSFYTSGKLPQYTSFSETEIYSRINARVKEYGKNAKQKIMDAFDSSRKKHRVTIAKRTIRDFSETVKSGITGIEKRTRKYVRNLQESKSSTRISRTKEVQDLESTKNKRKSSNKTVYDKDIR